MYKNFYSSQGATVIGSPVAEPPAEQAAAARRAARRRPDLRRRASDPNAKLIALLDQPPDAAGPGRVQHARPTACSRRPTRPPAPATPNDGRRLHRDSPAACAPLALAAGAGRAPCRPQRRRRRRAAHRAPAGHRPLPRDAHRPGPRLPGLLRRRARSEWIEIELRHTDWYKVRTDGGKVGWVHRAPARDHAHRGRRQQDLPRHRARRLPARAASSSAPPGATSSPSRCSSSGPATSCRDTLGVEATLGQVQGVFSGTDFWHVNLTAEPWSRPAPVAVLRRRRRASSRTSRTAAWSARHADRRQAGQCHRSALRYYLTERFVLRADYSHLHRLRLRHAQRPSTAPSRPACRSSSEPPHHARPTTCDSLPCLLAALLAAAAGAGAAAHQRRPTQQPGQRAGDRAAGRAARRASCPKFPSKDFEIGLFAGTYATQNFGASARRRRCAWATTSPKTSSSKPRYAQTKVSDETFRQILPGRHLRRRRARR